MWAKVHRRRSLQSNLLRWTCGTLGEKTGQTRGNQRTGSFSEYCYIEQIDYIMSHDKTKNLPIKIYCFTINDPLWPQNKWSYWDLWQATPFMTIKQMKLLRPLTGYTLYDHKTNEVIETSDRLHPLWPQNKWSYWDFWQATPFMTTKQTTTYAANYRSQTYWTR